MSKSGKIFAERINKLIEESNLSGNAFAKQCDLSPNTISQARKGERLSLNSAKMIAKACNVTLDYLFGASEVKNIEYISVEAINKHISPTTANVDTSRDEYSLPALEISVAFDEYLVGSRNATAPFLPEKLRESFQEQLQRDFVGVITEEVKERHKYVIIPIDILRNAQNIDDLCAKVQKE